MNQEKIGKFILENRKAKGLTQAELAEALGVTDRTISKWKNGHGIPEISLLKSVADFFDISITELLDGKRTDDKEKMTEKKLLEILKENFKQKKSIKVIIIVSIILIAVSTLVTCIIVRNFKKVEDNELFIVYKNGVYTNDIGTEITVTEGKILEFLGKNENDLKVITKEEKELAMDYYYSQLEMFRMYGFMGGFSEVKNINGIKVTHMVNKMPTLFVISEMEETDEYYCLLGTTKHGAFLLFKYYDNKCHVNEVVCEYAKQDGSNLNVNINEYCK